MPKGKKDLMFAGTRWNDYVKDYAQKNNITYGCAISKPEVKEGYKLAYPKNPVGRPRKTKEPKEAKPRGRPKTVKDNIQMTIVEKSPVKKGSTFSLTEIPDLETEAKNEVVYNPLSQVTPEALQSKKTALKKTETKKAVSKVPSVKALAEKKSALKKAETKTAVSKVPSMASLREMIGKLKKTLPKEPEPEAKPASASAPASSESSGKLTVVKFTHDGIMYYKDKKPNSEGTYDLYNPLTQEAIGYVDESGRVRFIDEITHIDQDDLEELFKIVDKTISKADTEDKLKKIRASIAQINRMLENDDMEYEDDEETAKKLIKKFNKKVDELKKSGSGRINRIIVKRGKKTGGKKPKRPKRTRKIFGGSFVVKGGSDSDEELSNIFDNVAISQTVPEASRPSVVVVPKVKPTIVRRKSPPKIVEAVPEAVSKKRGRGRPRKNGGNIFTDAFNKAKNVATKAIQPITEKVSQVATKVAEPIVSKVADVKEKVFGEHLPPALKRMLDKYGNEPVTGITVGRTPVGSYANIALNIVSLGEWKKKFDKKPYDKLYHLFMIIQTAKGSFIIEKNERLNASEKTPNASEKMAVFGIPSGLTPNIMIERTQKYMGGKFLPYSAYDNNCQDFIMAVLKSNNLGNDDVYKFVKQDTEDLFKASGTHTRKIANTLTDLGAFASKVVQGGMDSRTGIKADILHLPKKDLKALEDAFRPVETDPFDELKRMLRESVWNFLVYNKLIFGDNFIDLWNKGRLKKEQVADADWIINYYISNMIESKTVDKEYFKILQEHKKSSPNKQILEYFKVAKFKKSDNPEYFDNTLAHAHAYTKKLKPKQEESSDEEYGAGYESDSSTSSSSSSGSDGSMVGGDWLENRLKEESFRDVEGEFPLTEKEKEKLYEIAIAIKRSVPLSTGFKSQFSFAPQPASKGQSVSGIMKEARKRLDAIIAQQPIPEIGKGRRKGGVRQLSEQERLDLELYQQQLAVLMERLQTATGNMREILETRARNIQNRINEILNPPTGRGRPKGELKRELSNYQDILGHLSEHLMETGKKDPKDKRDALKYAKELVRVLKQF